MFIMKIKAMTSNNAVTNVNDFVSTFGLRSHDWLNGRPVQHKIMSSSVTDDTLVTLGD